MPVKRYTLDGNKIQSLADFYDQLSGLMKLPAHFGRNLDALRDVLTADVEGPFEINWTHADNSRKLMGRDFDRVMNLLRELEEERDDFQLTVEH
jgi:ribonuclease inhibitor